MPINLSNLFNSQSKNTVLGDFQDLQHLDGLSISAANAKLYQKERDDVVLFYFRHGANHASVFTQSKVVSENIKWNSRLKNKKIMALLVNTRNANAFTGKQGYQGIKDIAEELSKKLNEKQREDEENPQSIKPSQILFGCTGTIGEPFPTSKIKSSINDLIQKIKYTQNKYIWIKAGLAMMTTDTKPKLAMEECKIGNSNIKIYGIAKGSGMIYPNMATTLGYIFTDADLSNVILKKLLKKNIETTFNAISCDGDTSTNDMVTIFSTSKVKHSKINNINDEKLKEFDEALYNVLLNLAKRVVADGEGATKFITINVKKTKNVNDAKKICFSIANSPLVKTAIAGEDPNWGRILMAIGKSNVNINLNKISLKIGNFKIIEKGQIYSKYNENEVSEYMKNMDINIEAEINTGNKDFTSYTMDLTKKYIEINTDYRT